MINKLNKFFRKSNQQLSVNATLHRSCSTLSLHAFIKAYCNDDLSGLIISGNPSQEEAKEAWEEIYTDYSTLINSNFSEAYLEMAKQAGILQCHILYTENAVFYLTYRYDQEIIDELRRLGYEINYDPEDLKQQERQLNRITSLLKTKKFDLEQLQDQITRLEKTSSGKKQTEEEYLSTVFEVSKFQGYHIDRNKTTVEEFVIMYNNFLSYIKEIQKQSKHGKGSN